MSCQDFYSTFVESSNGAGPIWLDNGITFYGESKKSFILSCEAR